MVLLYLNVFDPVQQLDSVEVAAPPQPDSPVFTPERLPEKEDDVPDPSIRTKARRDIQQVQQTYYLERGLFL